MASDLGQHCLSKLQLDTTVTGFVIGGANNIVESGDLTTALLSAADAERTSSGDNTHVLSICVIDRGETPSGVASADVFIYDRHRGYTNIRAVRQLVISSLVGCPATLTFGRYIVKALYGGRSGHIQDVDFDLDVERIAITGPMVGEVTLDTLY